MSNRSGLALAVFAPLIVAAPSLAFDWQYLSLDGINATCIESDPVHDRVFVGTSEGFHYLDLATGVWTNRDDEGWIGRTVHAIQWHPTLDQRVVTGRENAFFKGYLELSDDLGANGEIVHMSQGGAFVDLASDGTAMYACGISDITPGECLRSLDGGETWVPLTGHGHTAMTAVETYNLGVLLGGNNQVTYSEDQGQTWHSAGDGLPPGELVRCLAAYEPSGDLIIPAALASTASGLYSNPAIGWMWEQLLPDACVALAVLTVGAPWPINVINHFAAVTADGRILFSQEGAQWTDETGNLPGRPIDIAYVPRDHGLYVVTATDGVYRYPDAITAVADDPPGGAATVALLAWPNPFNPRVNLRFELPAAGPVRLSVLDLAGHRVATLREGWFAAGEHELTWTAGGLASGVYVAEVLTPAGCGTTRLVLAR